MSDTGKDIRVMASALYHAVTGQPAWRAKDRLRVRANYLALCRQFVEDVKQSQRKEMEKAS